MVQLRSLLSLAIVVLGSNALALPGANYRRWGHSPKAVYYQTNVSPNSIVAIPVASDGTLSGGKSTLTGGNGGNTVDPMTGAPAGPDALSSQGSVEVKGNWLFTTNAGSNSISMFFIAPWDPTQLYLVGKPGLTTGDFPVTLAVSPKLSTVCVGLTGARSGVSCAKYYPWGLGKFDALRPFNLGQVDPPTGPLNGVADTFFLEDSSALIVTVKGDPTTTTKPGYMAVYPASYNGVAAQGTDVTPAGTKVLFGGIQIPGTDKLFISDAAFGTVTLSLANPATPLTTTTIPDQGATCWTKISPAGLGYVTDPTINHLVSINLNSGAIVQDFNSTNGNLGMIDFALVGTYVWALAPGDDVKQHCSVAVFDISNGIKDVQNYPCPVGDKNADGFAVLL